MTASLPADPHAELRIGVQKAQLVEPPLDALSNHPPGGGQ